MRVFWLLSLSILFVVKVSAQAPTKRQLLFSPPGINIAFGGPTHDLIREDRLDLGFSFEYPGTTLWYIHDEKFGVLFDAGMIFYQAYALGLRTFIWEHTEYIHGNPGIDPVSLRSPQINLGLSFKVRDILRRQIHGIFGYGLKTNSEVLLPTYLSSNELREYDGYYGEDRAFTNLYVTSAKLNGTFHHLRFGLAILTNHDKVVGSLRIWADYHPPYLLKYDIYEASNPIDTHITVEHKTQSQWLVGFRLEWYGLLTK